MFYFLNQNEMLSLESTKVKVKGAIIVCLAVDLSK